MNNKLILLALSLGIANLIPGQAVAGTFSGSTFDPGKIDSGIPGFIGIDGLGRVTPNNKVNPIFTSWATGFQNYQPALGVLEQWQTPEKTLGSVTGTFDDIASLGELNAGQIAAGVSPGEITLTFASPIRNGTGADLAVFENGFGFASNGSLFGELAYVEVSTDGINFARFPSTSLTPTPVDPFGNLDATNIYNLAGKHVNNGIVVSDDEFIASSWGTPFNLDDLQDAPLVTSGLLDLDRVNYVRIVDIPGNGSFLDASGNPIYDPWITPIPGSGGFDLEAVGVINSVPVPEPTSALGLTIGILSVGALATRKQKV
ncbi:PEP-CTERM sorting domain-containing protein [Candidatus Gracilibacteria bacterium]|nr:PEP-CTERM sorting domain-containing protein [Candidatus Gracilibacteria bacterium]NJM89564.1 PEP-CTERM sorting domain-containing protein [Hydrococcus sp. RU_2_2]NJP19783.1 PEP-CTERM sorting domain-containing protein [Hydrococcus sp. CRU_1_1]